METNSPKDEYIVSIKFFISSALADIDIVLLQNLSQTGDKTEVFTVQQIRDQLKDTALKMSEVADKFNINNEASLLGPFGLCPEHLLTKKDKETAIKKYLLSLKKDPNRSLFNELGGAETLL